MNKKKVPIYPNVDKGLIIIIEINPEKINYKRSETILVLDYGLVLLKMYLFF